MSDNQTAQTPFTDLLRDIPAEYRADIELGWCHHLLAPLGAHCHRAADEIERLEIEVKRAKAEALRDVYNWAKAFPVNAKSGDREFSIDEERGITTASSAIAVHVLARAAVYGVDTSDW